MSSFQFHKFLSLLCSKKSTSQFGSRSRPRAASSHCSTSSFPSPSSSSDSSMPGKTCSSLCFHCSSSPSRFWTLLKIAMVKCADWTWAYLNHLLHRSKATISDTESTLRGLYQGPTLRITLVSLRLCPLFGARPSRSKCLEFYTVGLMGEDNKLRRAGANPSDVWVQYDPRVRSTSPAHSSQATQFGESQAGGFKRPHATSTTIIPLDYRHRSWLSIKISPETVEEEIVVLAVSVTSDLVAVSVVAFLVLFVSFFILLASFL